jgi:hypothetical protein
MAARKGNTVSVAAEPYSSASLNFWESGDRLHFRFRCWRSLLCHNDHHRTGKRRDGLQKRLPTLHRVEPACDESAASGLLGALVTLLNVVWRQALLIHKDVATIHPFEKSGLGIEAVKGLTQ